jgi:hypothetical protein
MGRKGSASDGGALADVLGDLSHELSGRAVVVAQTVGTGEHLVFGLPLAAGDFLLAL